MAFYRTENKFAGRMLAYMEAKGIEIPSVDYSLDNWEIVRRAMSLKIEGNDYIDKIARLWAKEYMMRPSPQPRFYSSDIHKNFLEANEYLTLIEKIKGMSDIFWQNVNGMPPFVKNAIDGNALLPARTLTVFRVLFDLPKKNREAYYIRLCRLLWDWESNNYLKDMDHKFLWEIMES